MKNTFNLSVLISSLVLMMISCKDDGGPDNVPDNVKTGTPVTVESTTVGANGMDLKVSKPGTPVDGMEVVIPANSFLMAQAFTITYSEIESHKFGSNFNPISPMITIRCDGGYSSELMSITIPVTVPSGHIPIGFYLDKSTGKLEGIPVASVTANSITLLTRHFLSGNLLRTTDSSLKSASGVKNEGANIIISSISESLLNSQPIIASGYKPGTDDWEFTNFGSYLASGGHCAGQTISSMWYYFEKKPTEGSLFNRFSESTNLWQDNGAGYRFCSVLQKDLSWDGTVSVLFDQYVDKNQELDVLKLYTIAGAMLVTGEPQAIGIYRPNGVDAAGLPIYGGHALICYQVSTSSGKLYIADPNEPGTGQTINFKNDRFEPYIAKLNGEDVSNPYPFITYYAKTALIEWDRVGKRFSEMLSGNIGNTAPHIFPPYTIMVDEGTDFELKDGLVTGKDTLKTMAICTDARLAFEVDGKRLTGMQVFNQKGKSVDRQIIEYDPNVPLRAMNYVVLKPGLNRLGYYVVGWLPERRDEQGKYYNKFIDFKWFDVYYSKLGISPNPIAAEPGKDVTIYALPSGAPPKDGRYEWDFGDGSKAVVVKNDSAVVHKFAKKGDYTVTVKLYDTPKNLLVAQATAPASVMEGILSELQKCDAVDLKFDADIISNSVQMSYEGISLWSRAMLGSTVTGHSPLTWNGTKFSTEFSEVSYYTDPVDKVTTFYKFDGEVSANGLTLIKLSAWKKTIRNQERNVDEKAMAVTNVPFVGACRSGDERCFTLKGASVQSHVSSITHTYSGVSNGQAFSYLMTGVNYSNPEKVPILEISFNQ